MGGVTTLEDKLNYLEREFPDLNLGSKKDWMRLITAVVNHKTSRVEFWQKDVVCGSQNIEPIWLITEIPFAQIRKNSVKKTLNMVRKEVEKPMGKCK